MAGTAQIELLPAVEVAQRTPVQQALNGISYATFADIQVEAAELEQVINAIPTAIAKALSHRAYYFVPLTIHEGPLDGPDAELANAGETLVAGGYSTELSDRAICHRNVKWVDADCTFISTRLMHEKFALAFELFINVGHHFVDAVGVPKEFASLVWSQAEANVRGETSQDAWENRRRVLDPAGELPFETGRRKENPPLLNGAAPAERRPSRPVDEQARLAFFEAAFSDAIAIYLLSLALDFDYADLREREYPLLAAPALAERLRHVARLFPPNPGYEFQVLYRRR
jgi:SAM-dependent methyltransferase